MLVMPWSRSEPDAIKARRRQLAEQERLLAERMARLSAELHHEPGAPEPKPAPELPVWRLEDEAPKPLPGETGPAVPRVLARQRRRDKVIFFLCIAFLLALILIVAWFWSGMRSTGN
jgi:hypothetical protein